MNTFVAPVFTHLASVVTRDRMGLKSADAEKNLTKKSALAVISHSYAIYITQHRNTCSIKKIKAVNSPLILCLFFVDLDPQCIPNAHLQEGAIKLAVSYADGLQSHISLITDSAVTRKKYNR